MKSVSNKDTKKTSFHSLPLEIQIDVMKQLNWENLLKFIDSLEKDYRDAIEYLVDDLEYENSNVTIIYAGELSQSENKPLISIVDIRDITKWDFEELVILSMSSLSQESMTYQVGTYTLSLFDHLARIPPSSSLTVPSLGFQT
jgi:hypothetical protein